MVESGATAVDAWVQRLSRRSPLSTREIDRLRALPGQLIDVPAGTDFVRQGEPATGVHLVVAGLAGQFGRSRDGGRQIVALHLPGEMADLPVAVLPNPCCAQTALRRTTVLRMPLAAVRELSAAGAGLATALWRDCCVDAAIVERWLVRNGLAGAVARLANLLCEIAVRVETLGGERLGFELGLTQPELGEILSFTSVHVNRMVQELRRLALIEWRGRRVCVLDWRQLALLAEFDPSYLHLDYEG